MRHKIFIIAAISLLSCLTLLVNAVNGQLKKIDHRENSSSDSVEKSLWIEEKKFLFPTEQARKKNDRHISIVGEKIYFDGVVLSLGETLAAWKKTIGGNPRCITEVVNFCVWDNFGLEISTSSKGVDRDVI